MSHPAAVDRWSSPTTVWAGGLAQLPLAVAGRPVVLVADGRLVEPAATVRGLVDAVAVVDLVAPEQAPDDGTRVLAALRAHPRAVPVALGGGSVLDLVRLAALAVADPGADAFASPTEGVVVLPSRAVNPTVCVPTTLGTASEVSAVAVRHSGAGTALVISPALRSTAAVLDPSLTATLPARQLASGLLEPLGRALVPAVAGQPLRLQDGLARALVEVLLGLGEEAAMTAPDDAWRSAAAQASVETHLGLLAVGRAPAGHVLWPLATEAARATGVPKAMVLGALLPAWLDGLAAGELGRAWGSAARVRALLGEEPGPAADRLRRWLVTLGLPTRLSALDVEATVARVRTRWQDSGLFLRGIGPAEIGVPLDRAVAGPD